MRIISVELCNVFRFGSKNNIVYFDDLFSNGSTIAMIAGATDGDLNASNGAGKSSIGEAIYWAFFEKLPRIMADGGGDKKGSVVSEIIRCNDDVSMSIPDDIKTSYVQVIFDSKDGVRWRLKRGRNITKSKNTTPILELEEMTSSSPSKDVKQRKKAEIEATLAKLVGVNSQSFLNSSFFAQNNIGKFLCGTDSDRKDILMDIRGVNVIDDMIRVIRESWKKNVSDEQKVNLGRLEVFRNKVNSSSPDEIRKSKMNAASSMEELVKRNGDLTKNMNAVSAERDEVSKSLGEVIAKLSSLSDKLKEKKSSKESSIEELISRKAKSLKLMSDVESDLSEINRSKNSLESRYSKSNAIVSVITDESLDLRRKTVEEAKSLIIKHNAELEKLREEMSSVKSEASVIKSDSQKLENRMRNIYALKSGDSSHESVKCDKCGSELDKASLESEEKNIKTEIDSVNSKKPVIDGRFKEIDGKIKLIQKKIEDLSRSVSDESSIAADFEKMKAAISDVKLCQEEAKRIKERDISLNVSLSSCKQEVEAIKLNIDNKSKSYDVDILSINETIKQEEARKKEIERNIYDVNNKITSVKEEINKVASLYSSLNMDIVKADEKLASISRDQSDYESAQKEADRLSKEMSRIMYLDKLLSNKIKVESAESCIPLITHYSNEFLTVLKSTVRIQFGGDTGLSINLIGASAPVFGLLSGGEKEAVRLAVNMALSMLSIGGAADIPDMIFLDEVFAPLDVVTSNNVFNLLDRLNKNFNRICIIAHNQSLRDRFPASLLIDKIDGISNITTLRIKNA